MIKEREKQFIIEKLKEMELLKKRDDFPNDRIEKLAFMEMLCFLFDDKIDKLRYCFNCAEHDHDEIDYYFNITIEIFKLHLIKNTETTNYFETASVFLIRFPKAQFQYDNAIRKYEQGTFERNVLDDMRLSLELLLRDVLKNEKSLENQLSALCGELNDKGISREVKNMFNTLLDYYCKYQNDHVKHNDLINKNELYFVIELTSSFIKLIVNVLA